MVYNYLIFNVALIWLWQGFDYFCQSIFFPEKSL